MRRLPRAAKLATILATGTILTTAGGCIGDNFWAIRADEIASGLITGVVNLVLAPTGIQI